MIGRLLLGAALSAVVMMFIGFIFWVILIVPFAVLSPVPNEAALSEALNGNIPESGVYVLPFPNMNSGMDEAFVERHKAGPLVQIFVQKDGADPASPAVFIFGLIHFFVSALLLGGIMLMALPQLVSYRSRVLFIFLAGVFAAVSVNFLNPIWWYHPWGFPLYNTAFNVIGWLLAGLVMAWVIKPKV